VHAKSEREKKSRGGQVQLMLSWDGCVMPATSERGFALQLVSTAKEDGLCLFLAVTLGLL